MPQRNVRNSRVNYGRRPQAVPKRGRRLPQASAFRPLIPWLVGLAVVFLIWRVFAVDHIEVSGNKVVSKQTVISEIDDSFSKHPFSRNLITLGLAPLDKDLLHDQHFKSVVIDRQWPTTVKVTVAERQFALAWKTGLKTFLIDGDGVAVQEGAGNEHLPLVVDTTALPVTIGQHVAPGRFVGFASELVGKLQPETKLAIADMSIPQSTSELYVKTSAGYVIKFDTTRGVEEQLASLNQVLATLAKLHKTPTQYIDLRIPNRAYYL